MEFCLSPRFLPHKALFVISQISTDELISVPGGGGVIQSPQTNTNGNLATVQQTLCPVRLLNHCYFFQLPDSNPRPVVVVKVSEQSMYTYYTPLGYGGQPVRVLKDHPLPVILVHGICIGTFNRL